MTRRSLLALFASSILALSAKSEAQVERAGDFASLLEPIRAKYNLPAVAAAVIVGGALIDKAAVGVRKYGNVTPVTVNDQFHLGSDTKAMTATLCGMLIEQGKLSWASTLAQMLPGVPMLPVYKTVTLDHLLAHRSGFSEESWPHGKTFLDMHHLPGPPRQQREIYTRLILNEAPVSTPGTQFLYSNRNFSLIGAILEHITDMPWETMMHQMLFTPLGMTSAGFGAMGTPGQIDEPWQHKLNGSEHYAIEPGPLSDNPPVTAPAGTVHCTVGDWAKFIALHLQGEQGTSKLLKPGTLKRLHAPQFGGDYAGGWMVTNRPWAGGRVLVHTGSNTQNFAVVWMAPLKDFAVMVMTNQGGVIAEKASDDVASALIRRDI